MKQNRKRVGLLVSSFEPDYTSPIVTGVSSFCTSHNLQCFVFPARSRNWNQGPYEYQYNTLTSLFTEKNLDVLIVLSTTQLFTVTKDELLEQFASWHPIPIVSIGEKIEGYSSVTVKGKEAFRELLKHLITRHKCKKLVLVTFTPTSEDVKFRLEAFEDIIQEYKIEETSSIRYVSYNEANSDLVLQSYFRTQNELPDVFVCAEDRLATIVLDYLEKAHVQVPQEVFVTGFDDTIDSATYTPSITSVNQNLFDQGYEAAKQAYTLLQNPNDISDIQLPCKTRYRQSCGCIEKGNMFWDYTDGEGQHVPRKADFNLQDKRNYKALIAYLGMVRQFLQDINTTISVDVFKQKLKNHLVQLGIESFALCMYTHPVVHYSFSEFELPSKAFLFMAYDIAENYACFKNDIAFNLAENILPEEVPYNDRKERVIFPIYNAEIVYGYAVLDPGHADMQIYATLFGAISSSLASVIHYSVKQVETEQLKKKAEQLTDYSYTDDLTGIMNRRAFSFYGNIVLQKLREKGEDALIIMADMDGLKNINDTFGHAAGDRAIKMEAEMLKKVFRSSDIVARLGGDEFGIIATGLTVEDYEKTKQRILLVSNQRNKESKEPFDVSVSLGLVEWNHKTDTLEDVLEKADQLLYQAKRERY